MERGCRRPEECEGGWRKVQGPRVPTLEKSAWMQSWLSESLMDMQTFFTDSALQTESLRVFFMLLFTRLRLVCRLLELFCRTSRVKFMFSRARWVSLMSVQNQ